MEEVIEHLMNPDHALEEAYRLLRPGGLFVLTTPNLAWWVNRLVLLTGYQPYWSEVSIKYNVDKFFRNLNKPLSGHLRLYTLKALRELLQLYKFKVIKIKGASYPHNKFLDLIDRVISSLSPSLAEILVIVARKTS
jgi:2-polyprenyl-3-methyl-5-hydroxy-6-metoxy-1,4-benzoquinol methylase